MYDLMLIETVGSRDQLAAVEDAVAALDDLGLTTVWPDLRELLDRAAELGRAAHTPYRPPSDDDLVAALVAGDVAADGLAGTVATRRTAADDKAAKRLAKKAVGQLHNEVVRVANQRGDGLLDDLRPVVAEAVATDDHDRWAGVCDVADRLRAVGILPVRVREARSTRPGVTVQATRDLRVNDPRRPGHFFRRSEFRFGNPAAVGHRLGDLATARQQGARPGIFSARQVVATQLDTSRGRNWQTHELVASGVERSAPHTG